MRDTIMLLGSLLLFGACASQPQAPTSVVEAATVKYGACIVGSAVDQFTAAVVQHFMACGGGEGFAPIGVAVMCRTDVTTAMLAPASGVRLRDVGVLVRYRADNAVVQHDSYGWKLHDGSGAVTGEADTVERLLVSLTGAVDQFSFQIASKALGGGQNSHTVELTKDGAAGAVADLRTRCAAL